MVRRCTAGPRLSSGRGRKPGFRDSIWPGGGAHPGAGGADGGPIRPLGGPAAAGGPGFDAAVVPGGYVWWYVDALSDDGRHGLALIAFIGSVFSPYYAWSGRRDPLDHCAVNVALYGAVGHRWAMTERRRDALARTATRLSIGPSSLEWEGGALTVRFDEITSPWPSRVRGVVRLYPQAVNGQGFWLGGARGGAGGHTWRPIAPRARVEVELEAPACSWTGDGYFDTNAGDEPLEDGFQSWDWSRVHLPSDTLIFYDVERRGGERAHLALGFGPDGAPRAIAPPPRLTLPPTLWRVARAARGEAADPPRPRRILEDTPFYARSALVGRYGGQEGQVVHESLSLGRLRSPIVRAMLPFRMPRRFW